MTPDERHWYFAGRRRVVNAVLTQHLLPRTARRILDVTHEAEGLRPLVATFGAVTHAWWSALPSGKWDVACAFDALAPVSGIDTLSTLREHLVWDGQVVVTAPSLPGYTRTQLVSHLSSAGFQVTFVSHFNAVLLPAVVASRALGGLIPKPRSELLNRALTELFGAESFLIGRASVPVGAAIIAVAQRR